MTPGYGDYTMHTIDMDTKALVFQLAALCTDSVLRPD